MTRSNDDDLAERMFAAQADEISAENMAKANCPVYLAEMAEKRRLVRVAYEALQRKNARVWSAAEFGVENLIPLGDGELKYRHAAE